MSLSRRRGLGEWAASSSLGGEGSGEGRPVGFASLRIDRRKKQQRRPLTLTLSPERGGEGFSKPPSPGGEGALSMRSMRSNRATTNEPEQWRLAAIAYSSFLERGRPAKSRRRSRVMGGCCANGDPPHPNPLPPDSAGEGLVSPLSRRRGRGDLSSPLPRERDGGGREPGALEFSPMATRRPTSICPISSPSSYENATYSRSSSPGTAPTPTRSTRLAGLLRERLGEAAAGSAPAAPRVSGVRRRPRPLRRGARAPATPTLVESGSARRSGARLCASRRTWRRASRFRRRLRQRQIPIKLLDENRRLINDFRSVNGQGKVSFTHLVAWAVLRALKAFALERAYDASGSAPRAPAATASASVSRWTSRSPTARGPSSCRASKERRRCPSRSSAAAADDLIARARQSSFRSSTVEGRRSP